MGARDGLDGDEAGGNDSRRNPDLQVSQDVLRWREQHQRLHGRCQDGKHTGGCQCCGAIATELGRSRDLPANARDVAQCPVEVIHTENTLHRKVTRL